MTLRGSPPLLKVPRKGQSFVLRAVKVLKFNSLIPELSVKDLDISKRFYLEALGFALEYERVEDGFAFISYGDAQMMLEQINGHWETENMEYPFGRGINFQIISDDLDILYQKLIANGNSLFRDIYETNYRKNETIHKIKEFLVQDPDGYLLRFSQSIE